MRISLWHILCITILVLGLIFYWGPFLRYLFNPFNGNIKSPELMLKFLNTHTALDASHNTVIQSSENQDTTSKSVQTQS